MLTKVVEGEIARFLASTEPEVLCIKGKWGVGKTFAWNRYVLEAKAEKRIVLPRYAFVSLYGVNTPEQLRASITENTVVREQIGEPIDLATVLNDPVGKVRALWRKMLSTLRYVPGSEEVNAIIQQLSFLSVREEIVCLDDLERKGDELRIRDILGLATFLKEQRKCKVVLILNDGAFANSEGDDFKTFFEKTVDSHIDFRPSAEECAQIAIQENGDVYKEIRTHCVTLGITNIRVIQRIKRMLRLLEPLLEKYDPIVLSDYTKYLVLLGWSKYSEDAPAVEFLKSRRSPLYTGKKEKSEEELRWGALLDEYGLPFFSDSAKIVLDSLERGFFDPEIVKQDAQKLHEGIEATRAEAEFNAAWRLYHRGFGDDTEELIKQLSQSFKKNMKYITPMNANSTFILLRELGEGKLASKLLREYVRIHDAEWFDPSRLFSNEDVSDKEFRIAVDKKVLEVKDERDPKDVLIQISTQRGWEKKDIELLSHVDPDGYYKMFKDIQDAEQLSDCVKMALRFGSIQGAGDAERVITENAKAALQKIAGDSVLNKRRVGKYGITID